MSELEIYNLRADIRELRVELDEVKRRLSAVESEHIVWGNRGLTSKAKRDD